MDVGRIVFRKPLPAATELLREPRLPSHLKLLDGKMTCRSVEPHFRLIGPLNRDLFPVRVESSTALDESTQFGCIGHAWNYKDKKHSIPEY